MRLSRPCLVTWLVLQAMVQLGVPANSQAVDPDPTTLLQLHNAIPVEPSNKLTSGINAQRKLVQASPNTTPGRPTTASGAQAPTIFSSLPLSPLAAHPFALSQTPILTSGSFSPAPTQQAPLQISQSIDQSQPDLRGPQPATPQTDTNAPPSTNTSPNTTAPAVTAPHVPRTATTAVGQYLKALLERDFGMPGYTAPPSDPLPRRAPPPALDRVFPSSEFLGTNAQAPMGVNDNNYAQYPLEQMLWAKFPLLRKNRIRVYGWLNPGINYGTSVHSNFPMSYIVASRSIHWDQVVCRFERVPDTVQQEHMDWGFRLTNLYGEDYRFTTSKGWFSTQLLKDNNLTGYDPCEAFTELYVPKIGNKKIFDGLQIRVGRYISCPDIEAQLAPDNYLFTHSLMFTVDTYTQTGIQAWLQLNKYWNIMGGFHSGADTAPWTNSTVPTAQCLIRWTGKNNKDSVYVGINDLNGLPFQNQTNYTPPGSQGKDNLQQVNLNYTHVFNRRFHTVSEIYGLWSREALKGGTVSDGPVRSFGGGGGPGAVIPGYAHAIGLVNYTLFKVTNKDYITLRPIDFLFDPQGWRTGYKTNYYSGTIGWCHRFSDLLCIRPELRMEQSMNHLITPYDNGTRRGQITFACDLIQRF